MNLDQIAEQYGFVDVRSMADFAKKRYGRKFKSRAFAGISQLPDELVSDFAENYSPMNQQIVQEQSAKAQQKALLEQEEARIAQLARTMPITSGTNFEGYRIVRYAGYVSGDEVATIPMGFFTGNMTNDDVNETIKRVRNVAIQELKEAAANLDCNAVIALDFDYITIDRSNASGTVEVKIVLTANGTAVEIEPLPQ